MRRTTIADRVLYTSDEETEETLSKPLAQETDQESVTLKTKSQLDFGDIDFVIEQIENLPKTKFANDAIIYHKRGKRKRKNSFTRIKVTLGDENELLDLIASHSTNFEKPSESRTETPSPQLKTSSMSTL